MSALGFWIAVVALSLCNGLTAWGASFKNMNPTERPRIVDDNWFAIAAAIGGLGWIVIPVMFAWRYSIVAGAIALPVYILTGWLISLVVKGAIAEAFSSSSSSASDDRMAQMPTSEVQPNQVRSDAAQGGSTSPESAPPPNEHRNSLGCIVVPSAILGVFLLVVMAPVAWNSGNSKLHALWFALAGLILLTWQLLPKLVRTSRRKRSGPMATRHD